MNALQFAEQNIVFEKTSLITGKFHLPKYPFLGAPLLELDNIDTKTLVVLKASGCMGTVFLQIAIAKRILCDQGDMYFVAQTDDDSKEWSVTRGVDFIFRIPDIERLKKFSVGERQSVTQGRWLFRHKFLLITGPGKSARQSKQVRYVLTDESHLEEFENGALKEFDDRRTSAGWTGQSTHATTAPDEGREVDKLYKGGKQNEFHWRCLNCNELVWALWEDFAREHYNGETVFKWKESQSETETLESIRAICPHCSAELMDNSRTRSQLVANGDYLAQNNNPTPGVNSFGWSVFCGHWIDWKSTLGKYLGAQYAATEFGNLTELENFTKKQLCRPWIPMIPNRKVALGNFNSGEIWSILENKRRFCSFDFQEGKGSEGVHWWGQVDEFIPSGNSRRVDYQRLESWADCRAFQLHHGAESKDTGCDAGHRDKEVFAKCAMWKWFALLASDSEMFHHTVTVEKQKTIVPNPYYTQPVPQDSMSGKFIKRTQQRGIIIPRGSVLPDGWCLSRSWSKPNIGFLLLRLRDGKTGFEYGIPSDIREEYLKQLNSYMETIDIVKKTNRKTRILKQIRDDDHSFSTSSQNLVLAIISGYFPLATQQQTEIAA